LKKENKKEIQIKNENNEKEEYKKEKKDEPIKEKKSDVEINQINQKNNINNLNPIEKNVKNEKISKITLKKKELELLKKKEENYINIINSLSDIKKAEIKNIEKQINKQNIKNQNIEEGINVSGTDSKIEYELNPELKLENGFAYIVHLVENHIILLKLEFFKSLINSRKKKINKISSLSLNKQRTFIRYNSKKVKYEDLNPKKRKSTYVSGKDMSKFQKEVETNHNNKNFYTNFNGI
jgi:hypothetical protein